MLLPDFQNALKNQLPLRLDALQQAADDATLPQETTSMPAYLRGKLTEEQMAYWQQGAQPEDCQKLLAAIEGTTALFQYDENVADILAEEAAAFYNGQRSAQDAAAIIQNRVQTYLDEQG